MRTLSIALRLAFLTARSVVSHRRPSNKRSAAFLFVDFLHRNERLLTESGNPVINDAGLAALTLLVAESDPKQKETMIRLIMNMLAPVRADN